MEAITLLFILTSIVIIMTPGQDMILVMSRSIAQGKKAGIITAFGISLGLMGHTTLAALGLGALLITHEWLFDIIKFIGAAYLIYLGYQLLSSKKEQLKEQKLKPVSYGSMFFHGAISNIMNPKITIFYFAYLPQFITINGGSEAWQLFLLGSTFALLTFFIKAPIGFVSGVLSFWIQARPVVLHYINKISGTILVLLGIKLALSEK